MRLRLAMMAICPGAPMIYRKSLKGRALPDLAASYQVTMSLLAVVLVPVWLVVLSRIYHEDGSVAPAAGSC
jgi:predicted permease